MAIYNGNTKVDLSGISKVYCGAQLVYQKSQPQPSTLSVTFLWLATLASNITIYDYDPVGETFTTIYSGTGYQLYTFNYEIDKSHLIRFVKPSDNSYYIRYSPNQSIAQFESTTSYYDIKVSDYTSLPVIRLSNSSDGYNKIVLYIETVPTTIVITKRPSQLSTEILPNGIVAVNSYTLTSADLEPISEPDKTFKGWYFTSDGNEHQALEGTVLTGRTSLYAKWEDRIIYSREGQTAFTVTKRLGIEYQYTDHSWVTLLNRDKTTIDRTIATLDMPDNIRISATSGGTTYWDVYINGTLVSHKKYNSSVDYYTIGSEYLANASTVTINIVVGAQSTDSTVNVIIQ